MDEALKGEIFASIKDQATNAKKMYSGLADTDTQIEQIYFMEWSDEERVQSLHNQVKITKSPDGKNQVDGAHRLLVTTESEWSVPRERNDTAAKKSSEPLEQFADRMYKAAGKISGKPVHEAMGKSLLLHDRVSAAVISTADMVSYAEKRVEKIREAGDDVQLKLAEAHVEMWKRINQRTPYLFETWDSKGSYPVYGRAGLTAHYRESDTNMRVIRDDWGYGDGIPDEKDLTDTMVLCEWWDLAYHCVWIEGQNDPILCDEHGLGFIPIVAVQAYGQRELFDDVDKKYQSFLWTLNKSGMWDRQNLLYTAMSTNVFALAANAIFKAVLNNKEEGLDVRWNNAMGVVYLERGESYEQIDVRPLNASLLDLLSITDNKVTESTMYKQALGQALAGDATFSELSLLSQSGRLPLVPVKNALERAMAGLMEIAFMWMRKEAGTKIKAKYGGLTAELQRSEIPEDFEIECMMEVKMPTDKLQNANIADQMSGGDNPIVSKRWSRENILGIGQSDEMTTEIWGEQMAGKFYAMMAEQMLPQLMKQAAGAIGGRQGASRPQGALNEHKRTALGGPEGIPTVMKQGPAMPGETPAELRGMGEINGEVPEMEV